MAATAAIVGKLADVREHVVASPVTAKVQPVIDAQLQADSPETEDELDRVLDQPGDNEPHTNTHAGGGSSTGLPKFTTLKGIAAPLDRSNVDTDAIIPKQFLKTIKRTGLGTAAFYELRYDTATGKENPDFILNQGIYRQSKILVVTGPNFGCGSSREHAPWALLDFGIKCIIAPSFADIFFNNTFKNGMLPVPISDKAALTKIADEARAGREIEVDLVNQEIKDSQGNKIVSFDVDSFRKHCLVNGLDDIGLTLQMESKIRAFETKRSLETPWLDGSGYLRRGNRGATRIEAAPVPKTNRGDVKNEPLEW
jgi:3-isopropylmalate dehydratase